MIQTFLNAFKELTLFDLVLLAVFGGLYLFRMLYLFLFTGRVLYRKRMDYGESSKPLSLILAVRNEEENLKNNLPKILTEETLDFEVVAVDDYSQDNSFLVLGLLKGRYKRLKISMLNQETRHSMKLAQNIAIKAAKNDWVLFFPVSLSGFSKLWLESFSKSANDMLTAIVGFASVKQSVGFFNHLYRIENYLQYQKSIGYILNRIPFVYSEENVAFQKYKYFEVGGYGQKISEPYSNLELVINSFIKKERTTLLFDAGSTIRKTVSIKQEDYFDLLKKSIRIENHLSYSKKLALAFDELSKVLFLPLAAAVLVLEMELWPLFAGLLGFKFAAHLLIIKIAQNRLNERKIYVSCLVYDLIMPYFKLFYKWHFNWRTKKTKWRRKV